MKDVGTFYGRLVYFGICCGNLVFFIVIWYILPVLVRCTKKNLATLTSTNLSVLAILNRFSNLVKEESALKHFVEAIICKQGLPDGLFHTNPQFLVHFEWKFSTSFMNFWYLYFVDIYFMAIVYILWPFVKCRYYPHFGILYQEKSGSPAQQNHAPFINFTCVCMYVEHQRCTRVYLDTICMLFSIRRIVFNIFNFLQFFRQYI
jgi:hypothetical protein